MRARQCSTSVRSVSIPGPLIISKWIRPIFRRRGCPGSGGGRTTRGGGGSALGYGADADDVAEVLWQEPPQSFAEVGKEAERQYYPEATAVRLRRVCADVCDELVEELRAVVADEFSG
mmetsp:Transcript_26690/g.53214  ORF Transcript_26690/g.53214 Transcript_26690/m.53214 type:complete len:118 (+) Transcript_26690:366-719(+)